MLQKKVKIEKSKKENKKLKYYYVQEWRNQMNDYELSVCESPSIGDHTIHERDNLNTLLSDVKNDSQYKVTMS